MDYIDFTRLNEAVSSEEQVERTVDYLTEKLGLFLRPNDQMLICFPDAGHGSLGNMLARAVSRVGAAPVFWGKDLRWKTLLRIAFMTRASAIAAPPLIVLGLSKLAKATGTPLYFHNVLSAGYPCLDWMIDGIAHGLDCQIWGCFSPGLQAVVGGFSCPCGQGVHLRSDEFEVEILGPNGNAVPEGEFGTPVISPRGSSLRYRSVLQGRLDSSPCVCGQTSPRLMDITVADHGNTELSKLGQEMLGWTSILDCDLRIGESGLEMELVVFPGEKLPRLPSCAKQIVRAWNGDRDVPMVLSSVWNK